MGVVGYYGPNVVSSGNPGGGSSSGGSSNDSGGFIGEGWGGNPPDDPPAPTPVVVPPNTPPPGFTPTPGTTTVTGTTGGTPNPHTDTGFSGGPILANGDPNPGYDGPAPGTGGVPEDGSGYIPPSVLNPPPPDEETGLLPNIFGQPLTALSSYEMNQLRNLMKLYTPYGDLEGIGFWKTLAQMYQDRGDMMFGEGTTYTDEFGTAIDPKDVEVNDEGEYIHKTTKKKVRFTKGGIEDKIKEEMGSDIFNRLQMHSPEIYYPYQGMPQTSGGLESLGQEQTIDLSQFKRGTKEYEDAAAYNQMIFNARNELDRQWGDQGGQDGGQGIADLSPVAQLAATTTPEEVAAATVPAEVAAATTTPAATTTAMTTPTPFDYSQWPQFTSAYPGYNQYPWPNYVNQGLGQWPNFDYWNQIANAFPGMS